MTMHYIRNKPQSQGHTHHDQPEEIEPKTYLFMQKPYYSIINYSAIMLVEKGQTLGHVPCPSQVEQIRHVPNQIKEKITLMRKPQLCNFPHAPKPQEKLHHSSNNNSRPPKPQYKFVTYFIHDEERETNASATLQTLEQGALYQRGR